MPIYVIARVPYFILYKLKMIQSPDRGLTRTSELESSAYAALLHMIISVRARDTAKVPAEVPEDSRVLRERCLAFPTSDHLEIWLVPSGTNRSRQYYDSTMV